MLKTFTTSVSGWLGATQPEDDSSTEKKDPSTSETEKEQSEKSDEQNEKSDTPKEEVKDNEDLQKQIDEMSAKAVNTAKEWGTWLYGVGKNATTEIAKTAKNLKDTVEEKTILGEFQKEQDKFMAENKEKKCKSEAAVPPWVGYNEEESMKQQIMALSQDKRNFLRNPPAGVQFNFDYESSFPVAMATLQEDPELKKMRFELVPKQVKEEMFWRNYFYRVSLIKQSAQLTSLAQQTGSENNEKKTQESKAIEESAEASHTASSEKTETEVLPSSSPPENEFISDAFQSDQFNEEDLKKEMQMLGMSDKDGKASGKKKKNIPDWERELQAELQEYEVVNDDDNDLNDEALEQELMQQIEAESKQ